MGEYIEIINNVGFPILACIALFWLVKTTLKEVKKALEANNILIEKLITILERK